MASRHSSTKRETGQADSCHFSFIITYLSVCCSEKGVYPGNLHSFCVNLLYVGILIHYSSSQLCFRLALVLRCFAVVDGGDFLVHFLLLLLFCLLLFFLGGGGGLNCEYH